MLTLFQQRWASVDHVKPVSKGGPNVAENYVTACWACNLKYGDSPAKPVPKAISTTSTQFQWDGFSSVYPKLAKKPDTWTKLLQ
jgi:hypothetical protein